MASRISTLAGALIVLTLAPASAFGQQASCASSSLPDSTATPSASSPTVIIRASASADELTFRSRPEGSIRLLGCEALDSVKIERTNLPSPVEPGVTYRDVQVSIEITSHLDVVCGGPLLGSGVVAPATGDSASGGQALAELCREVAPADRTGADADPPGR